MSTGFEIEVVFATAEKQLLRKLSMDTGATVADALDRSGLGNEFPDVDFDAMQAGIWGRPVSRDTMLRAGDRVEIYRPLDIDPREARRRLALAGQTMRSPSGD